MPTSNPKRAVRAVVAALAVAVLFLATACPSDEATPDPTSTPTAAPTTEATPTPTPDAPTAPRFSGTDGRELYGQACAACHGQALEGTNAGPTFLNRIYAPGHHADISFIFAVERGVRAHHWNFGNMPPVEGLEHEQALAIIAFIREQQAAAGIE